MMSIESNASREDHANCDREPIHIPGAIQPHGYLFALDEPALRVRQLSANVPAILGQEAGELLGRPLEELLGAGPVAELRQVLAEARPQDAPPLLLQLGARSFTGAVHRHQGVAILELEPALAAPDVPLRLGRALRRLQSADSLDALYRVAVDEIRALTGFDRVLLYHFDGDGHGEVLAEARAESLEPFLGLHYPASDIPRQARELYRLNTLRLIPDAVYEPVPLVPALRPDTGQPLDLGLAVLRSVSPVHREYMANLGVRASMSISLLPRGRLWGLLSCGHRVPLHVPIEVRIACQTLGRLLSLQIAALEEIERRRQREAKAALLERLVETMRACGGDVIECLAGRPAELLQLAGAAGAAVVSGGQVQTVGDCPSPELIRSLLGWVGPQTAQGGLWQTCALGAEFPAAAAEAGRACGLLAITLPKPDYVHAVLWFRPELVHTVNWGGNPHKAVERDEAGGAPRLRPRRSFRLWQEAVRGRARPWLPGEERAAAELRRFAIEIDLARQVAREREAVRARDELVETAAQLTRSLEAANAELERIAFRDPLTGLANRLVFEDRLSHACARCDRYGESAAVLFIDLDGFKPINDSWGHRTGDLVLKEVGARLRRLARESDTVARLGGDEFVMLIESGGHAEAAGLLAQRVIDAITQPVNAGGREAQVSCSIGIGVYPQDGPYAQLIARADAAMYAAKRAGRGTYRFYDARMDSGAREMAEIQRELRLALQRGEFELIYQPKVELRTGRVTGVEALARWRHPARGLLEPDFFIPLVERHALVASFSQWALREAARQLRAWGERGLALPVAVNLSMPQLRQEDLAGQLARLLGEHGVPAARLAIEITESAAMEDIGESLPIFERLAAAGIALSIDDFGTGYSSLSQLRRLPVRQLKIDRSFVHDLAQGPDARAIINAVVQLAHALGLEVVAEGVETRQQHEILEQLGCDQAQGFLVARPMPAGEIERWMAGRTLCAQPAPGTDGAQPGPC
ncbi:EAL domain-containing protein [Caldimonas tepidiphila]|uniref:EAL domain-containing protein n=1 Tax=Caldimonas tepidiphila TaxID=2315841 RepID=UPI000E5C4681|nr:EAL domain-containing protein [Caldimonas tepidiphila]